MIISALKPCCYTCHSPDIEVEHISYYTLSGEKKDIQATISCSHMNVCKYYNADADGDT